MAGAVMTVTDDGVLSKELKTFERNRESLLANAAEKYVLITGDRVVGTYEAESDALAAGYRELGNVPFLVKQVTSHDRPINCVSGLLRLS